MSRRTYRNVRDKHRSSNLFIIMAKKDPKDFTVEEKLKNLYQLQTTLSSIDEKKALRGELPLEVEDLEDEIAGLNTRVEKINSEIAEFNEAIERNKKNIGEAEKSVEKYKTQLDDVQNNRQYDTLSKEIEYQELNIELCNKKIREGYAKIEECRAYLANTQALIDEKNAVLKEKNDELQDIIEETRNEEDKLQSKAEDLKKKIEPNLLNSFLRIRSNTRNGLGIVHIERDACGGCFAKIPPQRQLDIKMHKKIIVCEYCGRILIDPELAGVKIDAPAAETKRKRVSRRKKKDEE